MYSISTPKVHSSLQGGERQRISREKGHLHAKSEPSVGWVRNAEYDSPRIRSRVSARHFHQIFHRSFLPDVHRKREYRRSLQQFDRRTGDRQYIRVSAIINIFWISDGASHWSKYITIEIKCPVSKVRLAKFRKEGARKGLSNYIRTDQTLQKKKHHILAKDLVSNKFFHLHFESACTFPLNSYLFISFFLHFWCSRTPGIRILFWSFLHLMLKLQRNPLIRYPIQLKRCFKLPGKRPKARWIPASTSVVL